MYFQTFRRDLTTAYDTFFVDGFASSVNFSANPFTVAGQLPLDGVNPNRIRGLYYFDLSTLPAAATIVSAVFTLKMSQDNLVVDGVYYCSRVTQPAWTENDATWDQFDGLTLWTTGGGDFTDTGRDTCTITAPADNLVFANLAALAVDAVAHRASGLYLLTRSASEDTDGDLAIDWSSKADQADPPQPPSVFPTLVIGFTLPAGVTPKYDGCGFRGRGF